VKLLTRYNPDRQKKEKPKAEGFSRKVKRLKVQRADRSKGRKELRHIKYNRKVKKD